jgi:8-oxo-dGTP diphosphatase
MPDEPALLARGPWQPDEVEVHWTDDHYDPPPGRVEAADAAIAALRDRGSPSHDGLSARLVAHEESEGRLTLHLQPLRWALRLGRRPLAGRPPRPLAVVVAGALGAGGRRSGRRR